MSYKGGVGSFVEELAKNFEIELNSKNQKDSKRVGIKFISDDKRKSMIISDSS